MTAKQRLILTAATWQERAACLTWPDPDDFFPDAGDTSPKVLMVCRSCSVMRECGQTALRNRERHGVWGGMTEADRRSWLALAHRRATAGSEARGA